MPMIDIHHPQAAFTPEAQARLGKALTALLLKMEGAPDNPVSRTISWAFFHPLPTGAIFVGGKPAAAHIYKIVFSVPQGTAKLHGPATLDQRDALVKAATALVLEAEGSEPTPANQARVWIFLHEVPEATWGGQGRLVGIRDIRAFVNAPADAAPAASLEPATA